MLKWVMRCTWGNAIIEPWILTKKYIIVPVKTNLAPISAWISPSLPLTVNHRLINTIMTGMTMATLSTIEMVFSQVGTGTCSK